jgi:hypothetical protein
MFCVMEQLNPDVMNIILDYAGVTVRLLVSQTSKSCYRLFWRSECKTADLLAYYIYYKRRNIAITYIDNHMNCTNNVLKAIAIRDDHILLSYMRDHATIQFLRIWEQPIFFMCLTVYHKAFQCFSQVMVCSGEKIFNNIKFMRNGMVAMTTDVSNLVDILRFNDERRFIQVISDSHDIKTGVKEYIERTVKTKATKRRYISEYELVFV